MASLYLSVFLDFLMIALLVIVIGALYIDRDD